VDAELHQLAQRQVAQVGGAHLAHERRGDAVNAELDQLA
jgi:hypothetical protein